MAAHAGRTTAAACSALALAIGLGACGGSRKPGYCDDRSALESSVKDISNVQLGAGGLTQLQSQLQTVESNAQKLVSSAKGDFPTESSAIDSAAKKLKSSIQQLPSSPAPQQVAAIGLDAKNLGTSVQTFVNATKSKCD